MAVAIIKPKPSRIKMSKKPSFQTIQARYFFWGRAILLLLASYMVGEAIFHASGLRSRDALAAWPAAAIIYVRFFEIFWSLASIFIAIVLFTIQTNLQKYSQPLWLLSWYGLLHGAVLVWLSFQPLEVMATYPSLTAWLPNYPLYLRIEAALLIGSFLVVWRARRVGVVS